MPPEPPPKERTIEQRGSYLVTRRVTVEQSVLVYDATSKRDARQMVKEWDGDVSGDRPAIMVIHTEVLKYQSPSGWSVSFEGK